jgi:hypothetical protein
VSGVLEQLLDEVRALRAEVAEIRASRIEAQEITIQAYAESRSISPQTVRAAIGDGRLPAKRYGRAVRVPANAEIGAPVERAPVESTASFVARARGGRS